MMASAKSCTNAARISSCTISRLTAQILHVRARRVETVPRNPFESRALQQGPCRRAEFRKAPEPARTLPLSRGECSAGGMREAVPLAKEWSRGIRPLVDYSIYRTFSGANHYICTKLRANNYILRYTLNDPILLAEARLSWLAWRLCRQSGVLCHGDPLKVPKTAAQGTSDITLITRLLCPALGNIHPGIMRLSYFEPPRYCEKAQNLCQLDQHYTMGHDNSHLAPRCRVSSLGCREGSNSRRKRPDLASQGTELAPSPLCSRKLLRKSSVFAAFLAMSTIMPTYFSGLIERNV